VKRRAPATVPAVLALGAAVLCTPACSTDPTRGYSFQPARDQRVRTVAVPIFENQTFSHDVEIQLTEAIVKEIQRTTPWRVVPGDEGADTTLTGTISDTPLRTLSRSRTTGLVQEVGVDMTVDFDWRDNRDQKLLVSRKGFTASASFVPAQGTRERLEVGQHGAIQQLARDIVAELRSNW
jgi:hypothetical protein